MLVIMHPLVAVSLVVCLITCLPLSSSVLEDNSEFPGDFFSANESVANWDYVPRVWSYEDTEDPPTEVIEFAEDFLEIVSNSNETKASESNAQSFQVAQDEQEFRTKPFHRLQNHYLGTLQEVDRRQEVAERARECTQFRVDTRDAIICEKGRCDKFDFDWPTYKNQLTLVETTKHGMRFHRSDLAFASRKSFPKLPLDVERVKIDIMEIIDYFKPKPTTTTTTTSPASTTTTTTTTTTTSSTTTQQTTSSPELETDTPTTTPNSDTTTGPATTGSTRYPPGTDSEGNSTNLMTTFRVDTKRLRQTIIGFGGALSDSTCRNIKSLSPIMARSLMEDYYGERGLRYNVARLSVGSSDFSAEPYTNNDQTNATRTEGDDLEMKNFHLTSEDYTYKLPMARQAMSTARHQIKFFGSLWSPPIWMKNNSHIVHGFLKGEVYGPYYKALAELMLKWLEAYRANGIDFWGFTGLNEPVTGVKPFIFHNSLGITREDYVVFYKLYLGPMLRSRGFGDIKLMIHDDNKGYAPRWVKEMLDDPIANKFISGVAFHWYMNDEYENLDFVSRNFPDKFIISSEACNGFLPFQPHPMPGNWDRGVAYFYDIIKMMQKNAAAWVDWNMALNLKGGPSWADNYLDAPVIINSHRDEYYKSPMFYAIGHFSRFVEPESVRLDHQILNNRYDYPVEAVGFHTSKGYIVINALNSNLHPIAFKVIVDRSLVRVVTLRPQSMNSIIFKWKKAGE